MHCKKCQKPTQSDWVACAYCETSISQEFEEQLDKNANMNDADLSHSDDANELMANENLMSLVDDNPICRNKELKSVTIDIAIAGISGCGKSTLINALRGLKADDEGAAKIGCNEPSKPTPYQHKNIPSLVLWDLPGAGTENFSKKNYIEEVKLERYDMIILVFDKRFMKLDAWLAKQINDRFPQAYLFVVRTKTDKDLSDVRLSRRHSLTDEEQKAIVADVKNDTCNQLRLAGIKNPHTFMIDSHYPNAYDFTKLVDMFNKTVSKIKQRSHILTNIILPADSVNEKVASLNERIHTVSQRAAEAAVKSNRDEQEYVEVKVLHEEILEYQRELIIDKDTLECIALTLSRDIEDIHDDMNLESNKVLTNFQDYYAHNNEAEFSFWYYFPIIGQLYKRWKYKKQCSRILTDLLQKCVKDAENMRRIISEWKPF